MCITRLKRYESILALRWFLFSRNLIQIVEHSIQNCVDFADIKRRDTIELWESFDSVCELWTAKQSCSANLPTQTFTATSLGVF